MVQLAVSRWIVVGAFLGVYVITSTNSQFSLTASPPGSPSPPSPQSYLLCPGTITFTCSANEVPNLGTAIRWFFNNNATQQFPYLYFMSHSFPRTIVNDGTFFVEVQSARLSATPDILNAVITLTVNSSVLVDMNVSRLSCGREVDNVVRHFNIAGVDTRAPNLEPNWVVYYQDNQLQEVQLTFRKIYKQFNCDFKSSNATITTSGTLEQISDSCLRDNDTACSYKVTDVSPGDSVQVSVFNSVGSANSSYTVPSPAFNVTYKVNDADCILTVQCVIDSSQERRVNCDISITDAQSFNLSAQSSNMSALMTVAQYEVVANTVYDIEAGYGSTDDSTVKIRQTLMTGSCGPGDGGPGDGGDSGRNRGGSIGGGIGGTLSVVVAVVVLMIIIAVVSSRKKRKCRKCALKKEEEGVSNPLSLSSPIAANTEEYTEEDDKNKALAEMESAPAESDSGGGGKKPAAPPPGGANSTYMALDVNSMNPTGYQAYTSIPPRTASPERPNNQQLYMNIDPHTKNVTECGQYMELN